MTAVGYGSVDEKPSRLEAIDYILYAFLTALSIFCSFLFLFFFFSFQPRFHESKGIPYFNLYLQISRSVDILRTNCKVLVVYNTNNGIKETSGCAYLYRRCREFGV